MDLKGNLSDLLERFAELEAAARKLRNQNFADIVATAKGRVQQLANHPDLDLVHKAMSGEPIEQGVDPAADGATQIDQHPSTAAPFNGPQRQPPNFDPTAGAPRTDAPPLAPEPFNPTFDRK